MTLPTSPLSLKKENPENSAVDQEAQALLVGNSWGKPSSSRLGHLTVAVCAQPFINHSWDKAGLKATVR